jgi:hypothetical protein
MFYNVSLPTPRDQYPTMIPKIPLKQQVKKKILTELQIFYFQSTLLSSVSTLHLEVTAQQKYNF